MKPRLERFYERAQGALMQSPPRSRPVIGDFDGRNVSRTDVPIFSADGTDAESVAANAAGRPIVRWA